MSFGASVAVVADRAAGRGGSPAAGHYQRMAWLLVIGLAPAYLIWHGDILAEYAVTGAILFFAIRWRPAALFSMAWVLWVVDIEMRLDAWWATHTPRAAAGTPDAAADTLAPWVRPPQVGRAPWREQA